MAPADAHSDLVHFDEKIRRMRADISLTLGGAPATIDVTATHALRQPFLAAPALAVDRIEDEKKESQDQAGLSDRELIAAFDTLGGMSKNTSHVLKKVAAAYAARFDVPKEATHRFYATISAVISGWTSSGLASIATLYVGADQ